MSALFLSVLTAFILCFLTIPVLIQLSKKTKKLGDKPGRRKIHKKVTPSMGGIGIFTGFVIAFLIWTPVAELVNYIYLMGALLIIFILGLRDDIITLKPVNKLIGQLIAASIIFSLTGNQLVGFYGLFGIYDIPEWASFLLTAFSIIVITNSFNLIDGLDGLAGTIACIMLTFFGFYFLGINKIGLAILNFSMLGGVIAFLAYNWEPSRIFMGDTGALLLGFYFSVMVIYFINSNHAQPSLNPFSFNASVSTAICVMIIPLMDTLRIFLLRIIKGRSPFSPDKNHLHHALMRMGLSHSRTAIVLGGINIMFILLAIVFNDLGDTYLLPIVLGIGIIISIIIDNLIIRKLRVKTVRNPGIKTRSLKESPSYS